MKRILFLWLYCIVAAVLSTTYGQSITAERSLFKEYAGTDSEHIFVDDPSFTPEITISTPFTDICAGAPYVFTATVRNAGTSPVYQWQIGSRNVGTNSPTHTEPIMNAGLVVRCLLTVTLNGTTTTVASNEILMRSSGEITPVVEITASATTVCAGGTLTFTAINKSGNRDPSWEWTVNGIAAGTNSPTFSTNTLTNGAVVACRMRVPHCGGGGTTKDDSNPITVTVKGMKPTITVSTPSATVCRGGAATFTARVTDAGTNPGYQWTVNGANAGTNSSSFTLAAPAEGDEVQCVLRPDPAAACGGVNSIPSNTIKLKIIEGQATTISITASDNNICSGTPVQFTAKAENAGTAPSYQWEVNGSKVGTNAPLYTATNLKEGDQVVCVLEAQNTSCAVTSVQLSNVITIQVKPGPVVTVEPADTIVKGGAVVTLRATIAGTLTTYSWTPGAGVVDPQSLTPFTTPMQGTTTYRFEGMADNGCIISKEAVVRVVTKLYMPDSFSPNGDGLNDVFRIPPGVAIELKELAVYNRWGTRVFRTTDAGAGWDGRYNGKKADIGVYVYVLSGKDDKGPVVMRGRVMLVR